MYVCIIFDNDNNFDFKLCCGFNAVHLYDNKKIIN